MKYIYPGEFVEGIFVERPNRFLAVSYTHLLKHYTL